MPAPKTYKHIFVAGIVQGVGFRPFVFALAEKHHLQGWVRNSSAGVDIEIQGTSQDITLFLDEFPQSLPPLARIDHIQITDGTPIQQTDFQIIESQNIPGRFIPISPDIATCPNCISELLNPKDRRFRYPFINCTNCGPRFSIIQNIPYDRPNTTMHIFPMCQDCTDEYLDPNNRRFHAQPVACSECGPHVDFIMHHEVTATGDEAIGQARKLIMQGRILALKGLGGYQLVCDAHNPDAILAMRKKKNRDEKAFAVMAPSIPLIRQYCLINKYEEAILDSPQKPILILDQLPDNGLPNGLAPGLKTLGVMLPYTPLHILLSEPAPDFSDLLVMTSGNFSNEPIIYHDQIALQRLNPVCDGFLIHNRPVHIRMDDSVGRLERSHFYPIRRARGYAPNPILLAENVPQVFSAGPMLKNTFCFTRDQYAFISHHIGDLDNWEAWQSYREAIEHYQKLFCLDPQIVACDCHPDYPSTRFAQDFSKDRKLPLISVQHHHAHLASILAEHQLPKDEKIIAITLDGTGYGTDGAIWGGEILLGNGFGCHRLMHLDYAPLPGGDSSIHNPDRLALAYLWAAEIDWEPTLPAVAHCSPLAKELLISQLRSGLNILHTSSMGRLFDAVAAALGIRLTAGYEGQPAILLEAIADSQESSSYDLPVNENLWEWKPLFRAIIADLQSGTHPSTIAARFQNTLIETMYQSTRNLCKQHGIHKVGLSGGVWQNHTLLQKIIPALESDNIKVLTHQQVPPNDGGISLGQAWIAACMASGKQSE